MSAEALTAWSPDGRSRAASSPRVKVFADPDAASADWRILEREPGASPYQTQAWVAAWLSTVGHLSEPAIVVAYDPGGKPTALLPLVVERWLGLRIASFAGGRDSNAGMGLFASDAPDVASLLREVAAEASLDVFWLRNQPRDWGGRPNPMAALPHIASPSDTHWTPLVADPDRYLREVLSKSARKHLRQKRAKLESRGLVSIRPAQTVEDIETILDAYLDQRAQRAKRHGADRRASDLALRRFWSTAVEPLPGHRATLALFALMLDDQIIATFGGAQHAGHFSGMITSFDERFAPLSPGELLIAEVIAAKCREGYTSFDLGVGEARYKSTFCPRSEPLLDTVLAMTPTGHVFAKALRSWLSAKRAIKRSPRLWAWAQATRRTTYRLTPPRRRPDHRTPAG